MVHISFNEVYKMSHEYTSAIAIVAYSVLKGFGIEIENSVLEGLIVGLLALWVAIRRYGKGDINLVGGRIAK